MAYNVFGKTLNLTELKVKSVTAIFIELSLYCELCCSDILCAFFMFAISPVRLSVTFLHPTQATEIFGNVALLFGTMAIC